MFVALLLFAIVAVAAADSQPETPQVQNGGFERVDENGAAIGWAAPANFAPATSIEDSPHGGLRAGRIAGDGRQRAWRQAIPHPPTRIYEATGWFRATGAKVDAAAGGFARFYFHILYRDRPYSDTPHLWTDIPLGTHDWRRLVVRLAPRTEWPVEEIWVTVAAKLNGGDLDFDDVEMHPAPFRGGFQALEWEGWDSARVIADLSQVEPATALTDKPQRGKWFLLPYESGGHPGKMLWASAETNAPEVRLPLHVSGWHAMFVGLTSPAGIADRALLRLSTDPAYVLRKRTSGQIQEVLFKVADLTGESLFIAQQDDDRGGASSIGYVKLVPLTADEVTRVKADRADEGVPKAVVARFHRLGRLQVDGPFHPNWGY